MVDSTISKIKNRIDKLMRAQGLKRYTLAEKAGIAAPTIQNWYTKRNYKPTLDSLIKICEALNISLSQICLNENETLYPVDNEVIELINLYLALNKEKRKLILDTSKWLAKD